MANMYLLLAFLCGVSALGYLEPYNIKTLSNAIAKQVAKGILTSKTGTIHVKGPLSVSSKYRIRIDTTFGKQPQDPSCLDIYHAGFRSSGVYHLKLHQNHSVYAYCDMQSAGGGWTVFQRRFDGKVDFYRKWHDYKVGFGNIYGEYWLGNENIHFLTKQGKCTMRIEMKDFSDVMKYAEFADFKLSNEKEGYKITFGKYSGTAGDSLEYSKNMKFTTKDLDQDRYGSNCAQTFKGAWWYDSCHKSNLNGLYLKGKHKSFANGMNWLTWHGYHYSLKSTKMMMRCV